jgi:hypothetical protein
MRFLQIIFFTTLLFSIACNSDKKSKEGKPFAGCKCGAPTPIFNEDIPEHVSGHNFSMTTNSGVEIVRMKNGSTLQIVQTGCNDIKQEFSFIYKDNKFASFTDAQWIQNAVEEFRKIGSFSQNFAPFILWGNAMDAYKAEFKLGEDKELDKGFFMKIDKIVSAEEATMIVTVYADSCPEMPAK